MEMYVCSVYDVAACVFGRPIFVRSKGEATRSFIDECSREPTQAQPNPLYSHPGDFQLFLLGVFDDGSGTFTSIQPPERLMDAGAVKV